MASRKKFFSESSLAGGESSVVILQEAGNKKVVLKYSIRNNLKGEKIALEISQKSGVSVPTVLLYKKGKLLLKFIDGRTIRKNDLDDLFFKKLGALIKKLHDIKVFNVGDPVSPKQFSEKNWFIFLRKRLSEGINYLTQNKKITRVEGGKFLDYWIARFHNLPKRSFCPTLVHNDLHLDNILITKSGKLYLIDFEDSFYGDPLCDFVPFFGFHPELFLNFKKHYINKEVLSNGWQEWFEVYGFVHWVSLASFYVDIKNQKKYLKYLSKIRSFCHKGKV